MAEIADKQDLNMRAEPGITFGESTRQFTPYVSIPWVCTEEGPFFGFTTRSEHYLTEDNRERFEKDMEVLGFDAKTRNLYELKQHVPGREANIVFQVQDFKGKKQVRANGLRPKRERGLTVAERMAKILGNTVTVPPENEDDIPF